MDENQEKQIIHEDTAQNDDGNDEFIILFVI